MALEKTADRSGQAGGELGFLGDLRQVHTYPESVVVGPFREQVMDNVRKEIEQLVGRIERNELPEETCAAPGIDVLSLRARRTDLMLVSGATNYTPTAAFVGPEARYYRASGTSFSAPFVTGVASLLIANRPSLTAVEVKRIILQSARDIEVGGVDQYTGYGLLDAKVALNSDPEFFVAASITAVGIVQKDEWPYLQVSGSADADDFDSAWIEIGRGDNPGEWKKVSRTIRTPVHEGVLDDLDAQHVQGANQWTIRLISRHKNGRLREARFVLNLG